MKYVIIGVVLGMCTIMSCGSSNETVESSESTEARSDRGQRPGGKRDVTKMFAEMDVNDDGRLAKLEVKGRLAEDFDKIDADADGYITLEEMKSAPKPQRGERRQRRN